MMLDRKSVKFLRYLREQEENTIRCSMIDPVPKGYGQRDEYNAMMDFLELGGYVSVQRDSSNNRKSVKLDHKGYKFSEFRRMELLEYLSEKWVDFFAMLMAAGSLVVSVIALLSR